MTSASLPMRERGLKSVHETWEHGVRRVAPHAGAWIEIQRGDGVVMAWSVAPHAGAWIEIVSVSVSVSVIGCRSPCGSVD